MHRPVIAVIVRTGGGTEATERHVGGKASERPREDRGEDERGQCSPIAGDRRRAVVCPNDMEGDGSIRRVEVMPVRPPITDATVQLHRAGDLAPVEHEGGVREVRPETRRPPPPVAHHHGLPRHGAPRPRHEPLRLPDFRQRRLRWRRVHSRYPHRNRAERCCRELYHSDAPSITACGKFMPLAHSSTTPSPAIIAACGDAGSVARLSLPIGGRAVCLP